MKFLTFYTVIFLAVSSVYPQNLNFSTVEIPANITNMDILNAEVASTLDTNNYTHIAWIDESNKVSKLKYSVYNNATVTTIEIPVPGALTNELKIAPAIVLDKNQHPHITYFVKRNRDGGIQSGNFAVMYAGDPEGDGSFEVSQVSTNSTNPVDITKNIYNAYVNDRPRILLEGDNIVVVYLSDASDLTGYDNYFIFARKSGSSWNYSQEFNSDDNNPNGADDGITLGIQSSGKVYFVWSDISTYNPRYAWKNGSSWVPVLIPGYNGSLGATKHTQIEVDIHDVVHYIWFSNKKKKFCHSILNESSYSTVDEDSTLTYYSTNFYPATVDLVTGKPVYVYYKNPQYNIIYFTADGKRIEKEITRKGAVYGKRSLNVRNGFISFVTASQTDKKLYITTNNGTTTVNNNPSKIPKAFELYQNYPNPFNPLTTIVYALPVESHVRLTVYNLLGQQVTELVNEIQPAGWMEVQWRGTSASGIYFYRIDTRASDGRRFTEVKRMVLVR